MCSLMGFLKNLTAKRISKSGEKSEKRLKRPLLSQPLGRVLRIIQKVFRYLKSAWIELSIDV